MWRSHLIRIYENVVKNVIINLSRRTRLNVDPCLSETHVSIAAEVIAQILKWDRDGLGSGEPTTYVTQYVKRNDESESAPKRRRIDHLNLPDILEHLDSIETFDKDVEAKSVIPWLQILAKLFTKHPSLLKDDQELYQLTVNKHVKALKASRMASLRRWLLLTLSAIHDTTTMKMMRKWEKEWRQVVTLTLHTLTSNNCLPEGHSLLRKLIKSDLIGNLREFYDYFVNNAFMCKTESVQTLLLLLTRCQVPQGMSGKSKLLFMER